MQIYLVGGAVRDALLGHPVKEHDYVVVGATPEQLLSQGYRQVGKDFPVFLHPQTKDEYALARTERKAGQGYHGFICDFAPEISLEQDLLRRDLTVNAMAQGADGELIDPWGGQQDLADRVLRHVSPAFSEDPLRVLRVARFAARYAPYGFTVAAETIELMRGLADSGELSSLTPERVWQEMQKALGEQQPQVFFEILRQCGALRVLLPELDRLFGVPAPEKHHPEVDSGLHTLMVLQQAAGLSQALPVRFAALCHDLGKGVTPPEQWPRHHGHEHAGVPLIEAVCQQLRVPNECRDLARLVCRYHCTMHRLAELKPSTVVKLLDSLDAWRQPERLAQFALACEADSRGRAGFERRAYPQRQWLLEAFEVCRQIPVKSLLEQGLKGAEIKAGLHQARIEKVQELKPGWQAAD